MRTPLLWLCCQLSALYAGSRAQRCKTNSGRSICVDRGRTILADRQNKRAERHAPVPEKIRISASGRVPVLTTMRERTIMGNPEAADLPPDVAGRLCRAAGRPWHQPPVPNCTICGVLLTVALPPDAVTDALLIQTPAVANSPHSTSPARPRPT